MILRHFSQRRTLKKVRSTVQIQKGFMKPKGFWISVEDESAHGWKEWCQSQSYALERLVYEFEVTILPTARILYLSTAKELDDFTVEYKSSGGMNTEMEKFRENNFRLSPHFNFLANYPATVYEIDWHRVAEKYQGIIITPYIWECRLDGGLFWYYSWDCESGCIWDAAAIESVKFLQKNPIPKGYEQISTGTAVKNFKEAVSKLSEGKNND